MVMICIGCAPITVALIVCAVLSVRAVSTSDSADSRALRLRLGVSSCLLLLRCGPGLAAGLHTPLEAASRVSDAGLDGEAGDQEDHEAAASHGHKRPTRRGRCLVEGFRPPAFRNSLYDA